MQGRIEVIANASRHERMYATRGKDVLITQDDMICVIGRRYTRTNVSCKESAEKGGDHWNLFGYALLD